MRGDITPAIVEGREPRAPDEVALGRDTMSRAAAKLGDEVRVSGSSGELNLRVTGQVVIPTDDDGYPLAEGAVVHPDVVEEFGLADSFEVLAVRVRDGAGDAVYERMSSFGDDGGPPQRPSPPAEIEKLEQVRRLPQLLAGFMVLLGLVAIAHAIVVSVRRGRHDLGVLRAVGFRGRDVGATVAWQAVALAVVGGAIGLPLGVLLGRFVWRSVAEGTGVRTVYELPAVAVLLAIPVAALIAVLAALVPARRAARLHPSELLRAE
jgi:predicted lysophospholipase L1 biosynthesis ABC-type transport system permease subunit